MEYCDYSLPVKITFIGDDGTGKTSIIRKFIHNTFQHAYQPTIGFDICFNTMKIPCTYHRDAKLQIWDTSGNNRFRNITTSYYRNKNIIFLVIDITNRETLHTVETWKQEIVKFCNGNKNVALYLIANKMDLYSKEKENITFEELSQVCESNGFKDFFCVYSTKEHNNQNLQNNMITEIDSMFEQVVKDYLKEHQKDKKTNCLCNPKNDIYKYSVLKFDENKDSLLEKKSSTRTNCCTLCNIM